ncbi:hypothetical protein PF002_g14465 [Phytophthora fragariae]|uniref:Uncharacterized protein n=2 Tax=Phytophthora fragariae TaxID=53985 RepID=A0A6A3TVV1_9STRA|nr:hypothetical protein PF006_g12169 [Phytophthora fragariae]KAE9225243.1 hypothetical protein PF002_g14465 [Phytophthora fragariae]
MQRMRSLDALVENGPHSASRELDPTSQQARLAALLTERAAPAVLLVTSNANRRPLFHMGDEKKKKTSLAAAVYCGPVEGSDGRSLEAVTSLSMEAEWDPYVQRKQHGVGLQPIVGVLRNDRTPLNTPYTPQLMKLHLKRHEEYDERDEYDERPGKQLVTTVKSKIVLVMQPVHKIRAAVDHVVSIVVPGCIQETTLFTKLRPWVVWHYTAVVCVPFVMLLSPMLIALSICTSPIWISGIAVLFVRLLMRSHPPLEDEFSPDPEEEEETSPHHPNSMYRRAHLTNHGQRGYR